MIALALAFVLQLSGSQDTSMARAEALLAAGDVRQALKLATTIVERRPHDAAAHMLLGHVHYARPVIGRYPALEEFRTAARLASRDPEPWYWQMKVGLYLRSDDGEWIAREALLGLFAIVPDYEDAWARFQGMFHDQDIARRAERALSRHGEQPIALEHRAELLIELGESGRAASLLSIIAARGNPSAKVCVLRSEASFLAGRASSGFAWHDLALARADGDSTDALWSDAWLIATPDEVARHTALAPGERRAFYARFWDQRDPDLLTPQNERLPEHYARRAEGRRMYRLRHPQRTTYQSPIARAVADEQGVAFTVRALQDTAMPLALRAGLTAEGLVFLRYGPPDMQANCMSDMLGVGLYTATCNSALDEEAWLYWTPDGPLSVHFRKNEYFDPLTRRQVRA